MEVGHVRMLTRKKFLYYNSVGFFLTWLGESTWKQAWRSTDDKNQEMPCESLIVAVKSLADSSQSYVFLRWCIFLAQIVLRAREKCLQKVCQGTTCV